MGALTASYISALRTDISGMILLAPMPPFDGAVYSYAKRDHPLLSKIIPKRDFREGAILALRKAKISLDETKILPIIKSTQTPTLIILSDSDQILSYANFEQSGSDNINTLKIHDRYHPSMNTIGEIEHEAIISWLNTTQT